MWKIRGAPNNASKWQMGFNSAFKGLRGVSLTLINDHQQQFCSIKLLY